MILTRRLAALVAVLALAVGNIAVCAGWQPTAEARMACCMSDTNCLMQKAEAHDHASPSGLSQTQADSCCAASAERRESPSVPSIFASSGAITLVPAVVISAAATVPATLEWRALAPPRVSSIPKHLLLSVLLV